MDLLYLGYYLALFFIPFVVYFLLFKKNEGRGLYTNRDWFYFIKFYYAKKAVKKYQEKYRSQALGEKLDARINIPGEKYSNAHYIYGLDQNGNSLSLKFILRHEKIAEVSLLLRLADGNTYAFPGEKNIVQTKIPKEQWKINGLYIEILEPFRRLRITFNGLLKNVAVKDYEKVEHVQFNLIFNACGSPTDIPHGMDTNLLAEAIAREDWKDGSWIDYLVDQFGYEQFGALQGFVKGDSYTKEYILNLPTCRSKYEGICDRYVLNRELRIFIVDAYGNLINIVIKSFKNGCSQLNYGSVILSSNVILPVKGVDISLKFVGQHKNIPEMITTHIEVKRKLFRCVVHLNKSKTLVTINDEAKGYECYNIPAECEVNSNQACAVVEFWYSRKGNATFVPKAVLCERSDDVLPGILVSNIRSEDSKILDLTGGKGSSLALLSSLNSKKFSVPDGFIITVNAFKRQLESSPVLIRSITVLDDICCGRRNGKLEDICNETVNCFKKEKILPDIVEAIITALDNVKGTGEGVGFIGWAVRSSAVGEDSEELSAAGQNETFLGCVTQEQILKSVMACWASLFTYQSIQYRWQHGLPVLTDMAVVVQEMVPADSAGVLFTCHPSTSNPSQMVVTSNYGLGETVVSGKSDPDTFILNRTWDGKVCLLDYNVGVKNKIITMTDKGVVEVDRGDLEVVDKEDWSITQAQAVNLAKVGFSLEKVFGGPRDIEWAFYKGKLYLLQSRPITTLNSWSDFELTHELDHPVLSDNWVLTMANIGEVMPNALTVLSETSTLIIIDRGAQILHNRFDPYATKSVISIRHTGMLDVINWIHQNVSKDVRISSTILDLAIFGHPVLDAKLNHAAIGIRGVSTMLDILKTNLSILNWARINHATCRKLMATKFNIDVKLEDPLPIIFKKIEDFSKGLIEIAVCHCRTSCVNVFYQIVAMNVLLEGSNEVTTEHYADFALILSSCEDVVSVEVPVYLEKIAKIIRDEGYNEEFCTIKPEFGTTWLQNKCPEAYKLFKEFLGKHGHRSLGEFEVLEETWAENPAKVMSMIQANANCERTTIKDNKTIDDIVNGLVSPKSSITRRIIKFLVKKIQKSVAIRELSKSTMVQGFNTLKLAYRQLAKKMVSQGVLPSPDLIYHLTSYELGQVVRKNNPLLITKAVRRKRLYPMWRNQKFPEIMYGIPVPEKDEEIYTSPVDKICFGTPVCTSTVKARACVIKSLDNIDQLQTGDILITHSTDIGWSPYFPMLSGIVTELGGLISHGAVVAREYGLPCLVGVKNATKVFKTGDIVILSGNTGELGKA